MKKSLFLAMLAAALMGGQVFADVTGTTIEGATYTSGTQYFGAYSITESVTGGNVTIKADDTGVAPVNASVYGGRSVSETGSASNNTVVMSGGTVSVVYGGYTTGAANAVNNNVAIVTGGTITNSLYAAYDNKGTAKNNKVHLVGKGANNVSIANAQGSSNLYSGGATGITIGNVDVAYVGSSGTAEDNSLDIYGAGITITKRIYPYMQILTFNITDGQVSGTSADPALSLTSTTTTQALNLSDVELQVKDLDVKAWIPGTTITLVEAQVAIQGLESGKAVDIMKNGQVVALGQLVLSNENKTLSLSVQGSVPEPTTGTLSLLALAGLCTRRRKK